jgi:hypothetical protein
VIEGDAAGLYALFVDRTTDGVEVRGDRELLDRLLDAAPRPIESPAPA